MLPDQAYVSRVRMESFSLTADMMYVSTNAPRICRALFEICLRRGWGTAADLALTMCKVCISGGLDLLRVEHAQLAQGLMQALSDPFPAVRVLLLWCAVL